MHRLKIRRFVPKKGYTLAESVSKFTLTDNLTSKMARQLHAYPSLRGVKVINKIGKGK